MQKADRQSMLADQLEQTIGHILGEVQRPGRYRRNCRRALGYVMNMHEMLVPGLQFEPNQGNCDRLPVVYLRAD